MERFGRIQWSIFDIYKRPTLKYYIFLKKAFEQHVHPNILWNCFRFEIIYYNFFEIQKYLYKPLTVGVILINKNNNNF